MFNAIPRLHRARPELKKSGRRRQRSGLFACSKNSRPGQFYSSEDRLWEGHVREPSEKIESAIAFCLPPVMIILGVIAAICALDRRL